MIPRPTFATWFRAQYGPPPTELTDSDLADEIRSAQAALDALVEARAAKHEYETRQTAALHAWQARETWTEDKA